MTNTELIAAINANPAALAQANAGNDVGCAATISAALPPIPAPIGTAALLEWGVTRALLSVIAAGTTNANMEIASACQAIQITLSGGLPLDITNPTIVGLLAFLTPTIFPANADTTGTSPTPGSGADLVAYGSVPQVISHGQVSDCWLQHRPGGIVGGSN
jgi:hypothetical protein